MLFSVGWPFTGRRPGIQRVGWPLAKEEWSNENKKAQVNTNNNSREELCSNEMELKSKWSFTHHWIAPSFTARTLFKAKEKKRS
jgi:hypothetical protein